MLRAFRVFAALLLPICCPSTYPCLPPAPRRRHVQICVPREKESHVRVIGERTSMRRAYLGVRLRCCSKIPRFARFALNAKSIRFPTSGIVPANASRDRLKNWLMGTASVLGKRNATGTGDSVDHWTRAKRWLTRTIRPTSYQLIPKSRLRRIMYIPAMAPRKGPTNGIAAAIMGSRPTCDRVKTLSPLV